MAFSTTKKEVALKNGEEKQSRQGREQMEIVLKTFTEIEIAVTLKSWSVCVYGVEAWGEHNLSEMGQLSSYAKSDS